MRIFISYSRADQKFIDEFSGLLKKAFPQHEIWYDINIFPGEDWWNRIQKEVIDCDLFIYLLSNDFLESSYCKQELLLALKLRKRLIPILVRSKTDITKAPAELQDEIRRCQWIDMSTGAGNTQAFASLSGVIALVHNKEQSLQTVEIPPSEADHIEVVISQNSQTLPEILSDIIVQKGINLYFNQQSRAGKGILHSKWKAIYGASVCVFDISSTDLNTFIELGIAIGLNKKIAVFTKTREVSSTSIFELIAKSIITYSDVSDLKLQIMNFIKQAEISLSSTNDYCHMCKQVCINMAVNPDENTYLWLDKSKLLRRASSRTLDHYLPEEYHIYPVYFTDFMRSSSLCEIRRKILASKIVVTEATSLTSELCLTILGIVIGSLKPWLILHNPQTDTLPTNFTYLEDEIIAEFSSTDSKNVFHNLDRILATIPTLQKISKKETQRLKTTEISSHPFWIELSDWVADLTHRPVITGTLRIIGYNSNQYLGTYRLHPIRGLIFGRDKGICNVQIEGELVSKQHFRVYVERGRCYIEDLDSRNGTYVNGQRLTSNRKKELSLGDTIRVPGARYLVWDDSELPNNPSVIDGGTNRTGALNNSVLRIDIPDLPPPPEFNAWDQRISLKALLPELRHWDRSAHFIPETRLLGEQQSVEFEVQVYYPMGKILSELIPVLNLPKIKYLFLVGEKVVTDSQTPLSLALHSGDTVSIMPDKVEWALLLTIERLRSCSRCEIARNEHGIIWEFGKMGGTFRNLLEDTYHKRFNSMLPPDCPIREITCPRCGSRLTYDSIVGIAKGDSI